MIAFSGRLTESDGRRGEIFELAGDAAFPQRQRPFWLHKTKRALIEANCAIVCEGQLDLIMLFEAGITNVVAPQGTAFTENQARLLKRFVDEVVLCFDADAAGRKSRRAVRSTRCCRTILIVRIVRNAAGRGSGCTRPPRGKGEIREA